MPNYATISSWSDLERFGINPLTGEACAYSLRLLCDLNEDGVATLIEFFGGNIVFIKGSNWNSQVNSKPATASVLLPKNLFPVLGKYLLFRQGYPIVCEDTSGGFTGVTSPSEAFGIVHRNHGSDQSIAGRNVHQMTGRVT